MDERVIKVGSKYKHYKGNEYVVISIAKHTETEEDLVIYKALYDDFKVWARPIGMFLSMVEKDGKVFNRFEEILD